MRVYAKHWLKASVAEKLKLAAQFGDFDGRQTSGNAFYLEECKAFHAATGTLLIFTRDTGHHTSGWFKNPEYERCYHLSLSFREPYHPDVQASFDDQLAKEWCELFFSHFIRYIWAESPKSDIGKKLEVQHYRVFCDEHWHPILPQGEVYGTELTEKGWRSWSELHPDDPQKESSMLHAG